MKRRVHPYTDTQVIDARAPRFLQTTIGIVAAIGVATGAWWLFAVLAAQLALGLALGRRWCLPCVAYYELVQPRFGEGPLEDARPPRFANKVGLVFLAGATAFGATGLGLVAALLGGVVAALALLAATTGICAGCRFYEIGHRLRGREFVACPLPPALDAAD